LIYKVYLIDANNGIAILDTTFKEFQNKRIEKEVFPDFFNAINKTIDSIHKAMAKGNTKFEKTRIIEAESSIITIFYHHQSEVLICSISDAGDNVEKIKSVAHKIGNRFWKKHESDLKLFRSTSEKRFKTFKNDIEIITMQGKIAEDYPKLSVIKNILRKIHSMGIINDLEYLIALKCNGKNSPLDISRMFNKSKIEILQILQKLEEKEIISF
jgi:hypothetical protein